MDNSMFIFGATAVAVAQIFFYGFPIWLGLTVHFSGGSEVPETIPAKVQVEMECVKTDVCDLGFISSDGRMVI